jgi:long-chain acyl-CoA synthetase
MNPDLSGALPDGMAAPLRVSDIVAYRAAVSPDHPALVERGGSWTFAALAEAVEAARTWLVREGVRPGDRVMIVAENCRALPAMLFATSALDAWPVMVNARLADREIDQIRDHSGARRVIFITSMSPLTMAHARRHSATAAEITGLGTIAVGPLHGDAVPEQVEPDSAQQVAALIYTSGTTGQPKGVMLTHRNLLFIARTSGLLRRLTPHDRVFGILPVTHSLGLSVVLLGTLLYGATLYLLPRFDPAAVLRGLADDGISLMMGGPALFALLVEYAHQKGLSRVPYPALRIISAAGAPLDPSVKSAAEHLLGVPLHNGYGITECAPTVSQTRLEQPRSDCSVGPVLPGVEVKLVGRDGRPVGEGEVGELRVRGPGVMKGYYKNKEETAAAIDPQGWFNTRDLARLEDGHLFIVGRTKELIIRYGFNIYPPEIEAVLNAHPAVTQSAVIGRPARGEEEVVAFVQPAVGAAVSAAELAAYAAERLAPYKRPAEIILVPALPATSTGKILKRELASFAANS